MKLKILRGAAAAVRQFYARSLRNVDPQLFAAGQILSRLNLQRHSVRSLHDVEFKVFSQFGDDGIIQWLVDVLPIPYHSFVEFGVEDYRESNTRFLMLNRNWKGLVIDGGERNVAAIRRSGLMWKHELYVEHQFVTRDNINDILRKYPIGNQIGLLHIDIDGNDYWIWDAIDAVSAVLVIVEYNAVFGRDRAITVPYRDDFARGLAHYSHLYYGTSLLALDILAKRKGYSFIGCNSAGNNAYFLRDDFVRLPIQPMSVSDGFVDSKFRESRGVDNRLNFRSGSDRLAEIRGLAVWNVLSEAVEKI